MVEGTFRKAMSNMISDSLAPYRTPPRRFLLEARHFAAVCLALLSALTMACGSPEVVVPERTAIDLLDQFENADVQRSTEEIDLGTAAGLRYQISGWADANRQLDGEEGLATWTMGDRAELDFFVSRPTDLQMAWRCAPVQAHGTASMALSLNGSPLAEVDLDGGLRQYSQELPADRLKRGWNRLLIEHQGSGQRGIKKDTRVLWDWVRFRPVAQEPPTGPVPKPVVRPDGGTLFVPFGSRVDYYLDLPPQSVLVVDQVRSRGDAKGRLEVEWQPRDETQEGGRLKDLSASPKFAFPLNGEAPSAGRLSLFAVAPADPRDQAMGILIHRPRVSAAEEDVAPPSGTMTAQPPPAGSPMAGSPDRQRPNILVYLVDTLRADHLGCYGYDKPTSPRLDAFAEEAVLFENSQAQTPWTRASVASMLTGMWPQSHGTNGDDDALSEEAVTLAESLKAVGYRTVAITGNGNAARVAGFAQGFDYFKYLRNLRSDDPLATSADINEAVFAWLDDHAEQEAPFLLWVHTIDPHAPYDPPEPFRSAFASQVEDPNLGSIAKIQELNRQKESVSPQIIADLRALYDAEIAANDASFGALLDDLERRGLYEDLVVVFLSDHGEEFYDHGGWTHGKTLHSEMLDTPLLFRLPGATHGQRSTNIVQHVDLMPTLLEVAAAPLPEAVQGRSFLPIILAPEASQWVDQGMGFLDLRGRRGHSFIDGEWKLIQYEEGDVEGFPELYDRRRDRLEATNLAPVEPEQARFLAALRRRQEARLEAGLGPAMVDEAERAKVEAELRALGYIQ